MKRTCTRIAGVSVTLALPAGVGATVAANPAAADDVRTVVAAAAHASSPNAETNKRPVPLHVPGARGKALGGSILNHRTHVLVSIIGYHKFYRKIKIHHRWTKHAFWSARVSTQHCKKSGCWGAIKHWTMPPRYHYGKPVRSSSKTAARGGGDCPMSLIGSVPLCSVPWSWANNAVTEFNQKVINTVADPCAKGGLLGFGGVASTNIFTKIFLEDGLITKAAAASRFEGPAGYGIATAATCTVAVANRFGSDLTGLFH